MRDLESGSVGLAANFRHADGHRSRRSSRYSNVEAMIYRIGRELLRNAFRDAQAKLIEVEVRYSAQEFRLRIRDDGIGLDPRVLDAGPPHGHWGLPGVRERGKLIGAKLDLWSQAAAGTEVQITVPASVAYPKCPEFPAIQIVAEIDSLLCRLMESFVSSRSMTMPF
jgi:signal transduction histidine kinase